MSDPSSTSDRSRLQALAIRAMRERGLDPDFPAAAIDAVERMPDAVPPAPDMRDLRAKLWCSIDNDDSRDLDQLTVAEPLNGGDVRVLVAIADVDSRVPKDSAVDRQAAVNTTSVYTPATIFPMLPRRLSTDLTSLNEHEDRAALVVDLRVASDGTLHEADLYRALVRNQAKLAYSGVGAWLAGDGPLPAAAAQVEGLEAVLRLQDDVARAMSERRHEHGALEFDTLEAATEFDGDTLREVRPDPPNRAKALIENFMIGANGATAWFLDAHHLPSIRRVVRAPQRWNRIVALAAGAGGHLPATPDSAALAAFLRNERRSNPAGFADLSQSIMKLLGPGEYVVDPPGADPPGHFGLAVKDYTHSTAPNRRYPDLVTQRLVKAAIGGQSAPYSLEVLEQLAAHCTAQEDAANKVERQLRKSAAALLVSSRIGQIFDAVVTGASPKGTFVRVSKPLVEGMVVRGQEGLDVGDHVRVRLEKADVERGFIDFAPA